jgi:hypothetical protein
MGLKVKLSRQVVFISAAAVVAGVGTNQLPLLFVLLLVVLIIFTVLLFDVIIILVLLELTAMPVTLVVMLLSTIGGTLAAKSLHTPLNSTCPLKH